MTLDGNDPSAHEVLDACSRPSAGSTRPAARSSVRSSSILPTRLLRRGCELSAVDYGLAG